MKNIKNNLLMNNLQREMIYNSPLFIFSPETKENRKFVNENNIDIVIFDKKLTLEDILKKKIVLIFFKISDIHKIEEIKSYIKDLNKQYIFIQDLSILQTIMKE